MATNLFSLVATLLLDKKDFDKGIADARESAGGLASKISSGLKTAAKVGGAAIATAATGVAALTKQSVAQYAEYEQLVGGVETLFKDSADTVKQYAENAYKTAGLSANEYMKTVTSFSASLIQSTGRGAQTDLAELENNLDKQYDQVKRHWQERIRLTKDSSKKASLRYQMEDELKALKAHNKEVLKQAEANNQRSVTTEESLAKAAKLANQAITDMSDNANKMGTDMAAIQNAYNGFAKQNFTMLDNLKLGYGGTKEEMERLLADATRLSGVKYDISSYADIVEAIHVVQTELGITGTTAKEASETISGSIASLKSAWTNLVTGLGDENANFDALINNVVDSAVTAGNNLIPRVEKILLGMANFVERIAPVIAEKLPALAQQILPSVLTTASSVVQTLVKALPGIIQVVIDVLPEIIEMIVTTLADLSPELVELAVLLMVALANGLAAAIPILLEKAPEIISRLVQALVSNAPKLLEAGGKLIQAVAQGIVQALRYIVEAVGRIGNAIGDGIGNVIRAAAQWGKDLIDNFTDGIKAFIHKPIDAIGGLAQRIKSFLGFSEPEEGPLSNFHTFAPDMMELFARGITDNADMITDAIGNAFNLAPQISAASGAGQEIEVPRGNASAPRSSRPLILQIDGREFARIELPYLMDEESRIGVRLARA